MLVKYTSDLSKFRVVKFSFQDQDVHKIAKNSYGPFFSIFDVKYFLNKRTVTWTFRNPVKYNWNSTRKTKKKIFWTVSSKILLPEIIKMWEIAILEGTFEAWEPIWDSMVFMIL